jgi:hypothetical protein
LPFKNDPTAQPEQSVLFTQVKHVAAQAVHIPYVKKN